MKIPSYSSVIQAFLAAENDVQPSTQFIGGQAHYLMMRILEQRLSVQSDLDVRRQGVTLAQIAELR